MVYVREFSAEKDIDACVYIARQCWNDRTARNLQKQITDGHYFVAEIDDLVVGFAGVRRSFIMNHTWEVPWVAVSPDHQGQSIGHRVLERAMAEAARRHAALFMLMTQKPGFFAKFGFKVVESYNDEWSLMTLRLSELGMGSLVVKDGRQEFLG